MFNRMLVIPSSSALMCRLCQVMPVTTPGRCSPPARVHVSDRLLPRESSCWSHGTTEEPTRPVGAWSTERLRAALATVYCVHSRQSEKPPLVSHFLFCRCAVRLVLTAIAGGLGGIFLVAAWWRFGILTLCMLCVGLVLGFLVSSVTFFTPLGKRCVTQCCVRSVYSLKGLIWAL